jgi:hypothetical protein
MKSVFVCFVAVLLSACLWAQAAPAATPAPQAPAAEPPPPMHHHGDMRAMHDQHMQEMKAQLEKMHATLDQMKANLAKVKDSAARQQDQLDADLWEGLLKHMDEMVNMMSRHEGMGMGMMHGGMAGGMSCCKDMKEGGGCCGGNKCMQPKPPDAQSAPPAQ